MPPGAIRTVGSGCVKWILGPGQMFTMLVFGGRCQGARGGGQKSGTLMCHANKLSRARRYAPPPTAADLRRCADGSAVRSALVA